jgi:predicted AAA+ superfamily ATPase
MFERVELQLIKKRLNEPRRFIQVISGPRQVGKTTLVTQIAAQLSFPVLYEDADAVPTGGSIWIDQVWDTARLKLKSENKGQILLILDEIQKIPNWSELVKKNWDRDTIGEVNLKVVLLGSSTLLLQQGMTESLAGRFENTTLGHWSFDEMHRAFGWDADTFAWFGGYPGSAALIDDEGRWKKYIRESLIDTSISKDIIMMSRIDKPVLLKNLFELGCIYSGQVLSYTKILGQFQDAGNTTTLAHYLKLLGTAGLLTGLDKYSGSLVRRRAASPKFQILNNALLSSQRKETFSDIKKNPPEWGRVVESAVGAYLANETIKGTFSLWYWRERNDEVDFVIERDGEIIGIEVKSAFSRDKRGLAAFQKRYDPAMTLVIDNHTLPWYEFIKIPPQDLFLRNA